MTLSDFDALFIGLADLSIPESSKVEWVRTELKRFTYKEGWMFSVVCPVRDPYLLITFKCRDTYSPDGPEIDIGKPTPLFMVPTFDREIFSSWLAGEVQEMEIHESREWLRRDGAIYDDPHKT